MLSVVGVKASEALHDNNQYVANHEHDKKHTLEVKAAVLLCTLLRGQRQTYFLLHLSEPRIDRCSGMNWRSGLAHRG